MSFQSNENAHSDMEMEWEYTQNQAQNNQQQQCNNKRPFSVEHLDEKDEISAQNVSPKSNKMYSHHKWRNTEQLLNEFNYNVLKIVNDFRYPPLDAKNALDAAKGDLNAAVNMLYNIPSQNESNNNNNHYQSFKSSGYHSNSNHLAVPETIKHEYSGSNNFIYSGSQQTHTHTHTHHHHHHHEQKNNAPTMSSSAPSSPNRGNPVHETMDILKCNNSCKTAHFTGSGYVDRASVYNHGQIARHKYAASVYITCKHGLRWNIKDQNDVQSLALHWLDQHRSF